MQDLKDKCWRQYSIWYFTTPQWEYNMDCMLVDSVQRTMQYASHTDNIFRGFFNDLLMNLTPKLYLSSSVMPYTQTSKASVVPTSGWLGGWQQCWRRGDGAPSQSSFSSEFHCSWSDAPECSGCAGRNARTWWSQKWPVKWHKMGVILKIKVIMKCLIENFLTKCKRLEFRISSCWFYCLACRRCCKMF